MTDRTRGYSEAIQAVLVRNPKLPATELPSASPTKVFRVDTPDPLVVRVSSGGPSKDDVSLEMMDAIADDDGLTARVLHTETREIGEQDCSVQVQTYLPGAPLDGYPQEIEAQAIVQAMYRLHQRLSAVSRRFASRGIRTLDSISEGLVARVEDCPMKGAAQCLLKNKRFRELLSQDAPCLIYGDPWPQNFLLDHSTEIPTVRIVDIDPVIYGPRILQPAMLFSSYFVVSSLQHHADEDCVFDLAELIDLWPEPVNQQDVLLMMRVYPILLSLQKMVQLEKTPAANLAMHDANLALLRRCLGVIEALS